MLFDFDKSTIKPEAAQILDRLVAFMNENKDKKVALAGFTDNIGTEAYNWVYRIDVGCRLGIM